MSQRERADVTPKYLQVKHDADILYEAHVERLKRKLEEQKEPTDKLKDVSSICCDQITPKLHLNGPVRDLVNGVICDSVVNGDETKQHCNVVENYFDSFSNRHQVTDCDGSAGRRKGTVHVISAAAAMTCKSPKCQLPLLCFCGFNEVSLIERVKQKRSGVTCNKGISRHRFTWPAMEVVYRRSCCKTKF